MILKSIKLGNIRSYTSQEITFPEGSTLLCGDVGAGKSSILLAVEFALFGLRRTELPGTSLLRKGKNEGYVELKLDIEGKETIIRRALKKTAQGVNQAAGYIIRDGKKLDATAVELKSIILDMLGYPKELVTKSKSLVYRYTVYTPQEQMKQILMDEHEHRIDTLRKVFGIDKYKRISENALLFVKSLKEKRKELAGIISDLEQKKTEKEKTSKEAAEIEVRITAMLPKIKEAKSKAMEKEAELKKTEKEVQELINIRNSLKICEIKLQEKVSLRSRNNMELESATKHIDSIKKRIEEYRKRSNDLEKEMGKQPKPEDKQKIQKEIGDTENALDLIKQKITEHETLKKGSEKLKTDIGKLENCPVCLQPVGENHKSQVCGAEDIKIREKTVEIEKLAKEKSEKEKILLGLRENMEKFQQDETAMAKKKLEYEATLNNAKEIERQLSENDSKIKSITEMQTRIKEDVAKINTEKMELSSKLESIKNSEEKHLTIRKEFDELKKEDSRLSTEKAVLDERKNGIMKIVGMLEQDIKRKTKEKDKLTHLSQMQNWLEEYFINLMSVMEKHVLLRVHREFDELFRNWFRMLLEDEQISARLNDEFSPVMEQNGYETEFENLSGGEKTALSLAYRLSLNKVINDVISGIRTKDIIILDEPTDGFSSEQLDKVKEVIEELDMKQIIIVSHESKIESFVDNIVRISKDSHVSSAGN